MQLTDYIRDIHDYPKEGIIFKDITPLMGNKYAFAKAVETLSKLAPSDIIIDKVVGIEARGFFFAPILASKLGAGFIPVRKPKKLPYDRISEEYILEYGTDTLEIHKDAIQPGDRVLLHDDVLATGGTAEAVIRLIERLGGEVVQCNFLIELRFLKGKERISSIPIASAIVY